MTQMDFVLAALGAIIGLLWYISGQLADMIAILREIRDINRSKR